MQEVKRDIDFWIGQLTNESVSLAEVTFELDSLNFRGAYLACRGKASSLISTTQIQRLQVRSLFLSTTFDKDSRKRRRALPTILTTRVVTAIRTGRVAAFLGRLK